MIPLSNAVCVEYYPSCEVMFMGMANIHSIRKSFQSLRTLCAQVPDPVKWVELGHSSRLVKAQLFTESRFAHRDSDRFGFI